MKRNLFLLASLFGLVAGCAAPTQSPFPTPYPPDYLPTVIALTAGAIGVSSTGTFVASVPTEVPTETPEPTLSPTSFPTFTPTSIPGHNPAAIQFTSPGPMSKVVSPITLRMNVITGETRSLQIDLYGEDGRLLSRNLKRNVPGSREGVSQSIKIPFEIRTTAEVARVTVTMLDKEGRIIALNSVRVLLLSSGSNEITTPGNPSEPIGVFSPLPTESVSGGVLTVRGDLWPFSLQPVIFELVSPDGKPIGSRILAVENINPQLFETTIPYKVSDPTLARLVIRQDDDRMPGVFYVYTQEVLLNP